MRQPEATMACDGENGSYKVFMHHRQPGDSTVQAAYLPLPDSARRVESVLDFNDIDPLAVLGLLESVTRNRREMRALGAVSTISVMRVCRRRDRRPQAGPFRGSITHVAGTRTGRGGSRVFSDENGL
jgi:hypothetical protein